MIENGCQSRHSFTLIHERNRKVIIVRDCITSRDLCLSIDPIVGHECRTQSAICALFPAILGGFGSVQ